MKDALTRMAAGAVRAMYRSNTYRVFHLFPDLTVSHLRAHWGNWYIAIVQYAPLTEARSQMRVWLYPAPFPAKRAWLTA